MVGLSALALSSCRVVLQVLYITYPRLLIVEYDESFLLVMEASIFIHVI